MMTTNTIDLKEEKETLFITLYARALDCQSPNPILRDYAAADLAKKIKYDFSKHASKSSHAIVIRAKQFDDWINEFISKYDTPTVVHLGCGLDTRVFRINPPSSVQWIDIDYPEVIELRQTLFDDHKNCEMIKSSITDAEWFNQIPNKNPTLIVAEGVFEYLSEDDVKMLLNRITNHFPHGEVVFDVMNSFAIEAGKKRLAETTGAVHKWAVNDLRDVDRLNPRMKRIRSLSLLRSRYMRKLTFRERFVFGLLSMAPAFKNMLRMLRYRY
jgi:methyltransferase (TIGR00027 family)